MTNELPPEYDQAKAFDIRVQKLQAAGSPYAFRLRIPRELEREAKVAMIRAGLHSLSDWIIIAIEEKLKREAAG